MPNTLKLTFAPRFLLDQIEDFVVVVALVPDVSNYFRLVEILKWFAALMAASLRENKAAALEPLVVSFPVL